MHGNIIRKSFLLFFLFLGTDCSFSFAQDRAKIDSLESTLLSSKQDTEIVNVLNLLSHMLAADNTSKAIFYVNQALDLSESIKFEYGVASAYSNLGLIQNVKGNYDSSIYFFNRCIESVTSNKNKYIKANAVNSIGTIYSNRGNLNLALENFIKALKMFESVGYKKGIASCLSNIGLIYTDLNKHKEALNYQTEGLEVRKEIEDRYGIGLSLTYIGTCYYNLGDIDRSLDFFFRSVEVKEDLNDAFGLADVLRCIGKAYVEKKFYEMALDFYAQSLKIYSEKLHDKIGMLTLYNNISEAYILTGDINLAKRNAMLAKRIGEEMGARQLLKNTYNAIAKIYRQQHDYDSAFYYAEMYDALKDSIFNTNSSQQINELQIKYNSEKHQQENEILTQKNQISELEILEQKSRLFLLGALFLVTLVIIILLFNRRKLKQTRFLNQELIRLEKIRLNAIIKAQEKERRRIAEELHDGIGQTLSAVKLNVSSLEQGFNAKQLHNAINLIDDSCREIRNVAHNLMPGVLMKMGLVPALKDLIEKINDSRALQIHFNIEGEVARLEEHIEINIFRIVQELLTNIVKYAEATEVQITFTIASDSIELMLEDNGKGFNQKEILSKNGNGWTNINSRLNLMNGKVEIDSKENKGTVIFIIIPRTT